MIRFFALALFSVVWLPASCQEEEVAEQIALEQVGDIPPVTWIEFQDALIAADTLGKALLVDVYATWCPWCAKMQDSVYTQDRIRSYVAEHFVTARLNVEKEDDQINFKGYTLNSAELASGFGAEATPTTVFLTSTGDYITRLPGYLDADGFMHVLRYIGTEAYKHKSFQDFVDEEAG
ncbi:MAG: thioredoxin fold domain-containing protein [Rhodothermales bacterium]